MAIIVTPQVLTTATAIGGIMAGLAGKVLSEQGLLDAPNLVTFSRAATLGGLAVLVAGVAHIIFDSIAEKSSKEWLQKNWFIVSAGVMGAVALVNNLSLVQTAAIMSPASLGAFVAYKITTH